MSTNRDLANIPKKIEKIDKLTFLYMIALKTNRRSPYFLPSLNNANDLLCQDDC